MNDKSKILFSILHDEKYSLNNMEKHIILNDKNIFLIDSMLMIDINTTYIPKWGKFKNIYWMIKIYLNILSIL